MAQRGQKSSKREAEAGKKNLEAWLKANPSRGNLRHGVYSRVIDNRYADRTTKEGKALGVIMDQIEADIEPETARQHLLIAQIRSKLIVILQITKYIESLPDVVNRRKGKIPYVLDSTFPRYSASLRRLLKGLYGANGGKGSGKGSGQGAELTRGRRAPPSTFIKR